MANEVTEELYKMILRLGEGDEMQKAVASIRKSLENQKISASELNLSLFYKYKELCYQLEESHKVELLPSVPSTVLEVKDSDLTGFKALCTNVFWLRFITAVLSLVSFSVLASTKIVEDNEYRPQRQFLGNCSVRVHGSFSVQPYRGLLAMGIIDYLYSLFFVVFYLLPLDENGKKYIPGLNGLCTQLGPGPVVEQLFQRMLGFFQQQGFIFSVQPSPQVFSYCEYFFCGIYSAFVFIFTSADVILLMLSTVFCVLSSITMEQAVEYTWKTTDSRSEILSYDSYFTIGTFFETFAAHNNLLHCISKHNNPSQALNVSIAMMYLTMCCLAANAWISYRYWTQKRSAPTASDTTVPAPSIKTEGEVGTNVELREESKNLEINDTVDL